jgi:hypothetical protein
MALGTRGRLQVVGAVHAALRDRRHAGRLLLGMHPSANTTHSSPSLAISPHSTHRHGTLHCIAVGVAHSVLQSISALIAVYSCYHYMSSSPSPSPSPSCCLPPIRLLCFWPWPSSFHIPCKNPVLAPPSSVACLTHHLNVMLATRNQCL